MVIIAAAAIGILTMGAVTAATLSGSIAQPRKDTQADFGGLNSAHEHAAFLVKIAGNYVDFSQSRYQVKSPFIHVENGIGTTIHKHAIYAPFGEFLRSVNMNIIDGCFIMDDGKQYCQNGDAKLRFFLNGIERPISTLMSYIPVDDDRFLVIYGNESPVQIQTELDRLAALPIIRSAPQPS